MKTRFAPSPTGLLHVGNLRIALVNMFLARRAGGIFVLRIDDTDITRCTTELYNQLIEDLKWMGIEWNGLFHQKHRLEEYEDRFQELLKKGWLYPCYETLQELEIKRKKKLSMGLPPIYDRASLSLTASQISSYQKQGRRPHYRFLLQPKTIMWQDIIKGFVQFHGSKLSDPIIRREDGTYTYMLCSSIDDSDYMVTDIVRGEDHMTNTAMQIQMFRALGARLPNFGHLSLLKSSNGKISKREGGFSIKDLRHKGILPMTINCFLAYLGTNLGATATLDMQELIDKFDISIFSKTSVIFEEKEILTLNTRIIRKLNYDKALDFYPFLKEVSPSLWNAIRANLDRPEDALSWLKILCDGPNIHPGTFSEEEKTLLSKAIPLLPALIDNKAWKIWMQRIATETGLSGKKLYLPFRMAITGQAKGPEMAGILPLIGSGAIEARLEEAINS